MNELDTLLIQIQDRIRIEAGQFLVSPDAVQTHGDLIRRHKSDIALSMGFCPVCLGELVVKVEEMEFLERTGRHVHCQVEWHYTDWKF